VPSTFTFSSNSLPAYTAVDKAEDEGKELDEKVNVDGTRHVAEAAKAVGATLVYDQQLYKQHNDK
jgi:hypothetical protein